MPSPPVVSEKVANDIVDAVESLLLEAGQATRPVELDPYRSRLFELFVMADAAGCLLEDAEWDLSVDGVGRELAERWSLAEAMEDSVQQQSKLPPEHLSKMRLLWSFLRMWMEWSYAWERWAEYHEDAQSN